MSFSEAKKQLIYLELEKAHFNTANAVAVFNRATVMYFILLLFAMFGLVNHYISKTMLNTLIIISLLILITGATPYFRSMIQEREQINRLIKDLKKK